MIEVGLWGAFLAGLLSFITPCVLPMVPFQLAFLAGSSINDLKSDNPDHWQFRRVAIINSVAFALGLVTIFVLLGLGASALGGMVGAHKNTLRVIAGIAIYIFGLHFVGLFKIPFLMGEHRKSGPASVQNIFVAYLVGLAFAFGWTACVGPILASILFVAAQLDSIAQGGLLLFAYGMGMALPFILAAIFFCTFSETYAKYRHLLDKVEILAGVMMITFGVLLVTNQVKEIANWMIETFPAFISWL